MVQSNDPILKANYVSTSSEDYEELVSYKPDPNITAYIRSIRLYVEAVTAATLTIFQFKIDVNGVSKIKDEAIVNASTVFDFGGDLKLVGDRDKGITVYIKTDGSDTVRALGTITGVKVKKK